MKIKSKWRWQKNVLRSTINRGLML